jgi:diacylglycerol kinase
MIRLRQFFYSVRHALRGVAVVFRDEQSFRLQTAAAVAAVSLGLYLRVPSTHLLILLAMVAAVLTLEIVNSIFERLADAFKPRLHPMVRDVKDAMAGSVLIVSVVSALVGIVIFWPYLAKLL